MKNSENQAMHHGLAIQSFGRCPCGCGHPRRPYRYTASDDCVFYSPDDFKTARLNLGLKQSELATVLKMTERTVSRYETGESTIPHVVELAMRGLKNG